MSLLEILTKSLVDQMIALEFSNESEINEDFVMKIMEQTGANFALLDQVGVEEFRGFLVKIADSYEIDEHRNFTLSILEDFGL